MTHRSKNARRCVLSEKLPVPLDIAFSLRHGYERMTVAEQRPAATYSRASGRPNFSGMFLRRSVVLVATLLGMIASLLVDVSPVGAAMNRSESLLANEMFDQLNDERAARSLPSLTLDTSLDVATRQWSERLEDNGYLSHSNDGRAEIVAYGWNTGQITDAWMRSAGHRHLVTDPNLVPTSVSISCDRDGRMWAVVQFRRLDTSLGTQTSSPTSPIATPSTDGASCTNPPEDVGTDTVNAIKRLYRAYYLRDSDTSGLTYWRNQAATGMSLWEISEHFAQAPEFDARYGDLSDREFVDLVYRNVMGRGADSGGLSYWLDRLRSGITRGEMMTFFSDSPEYRERTGIF